jgi:hypothetical protein
MRKTALSEIISTVHHGSCGTASFGHGTENNMAGDIYEVRQRYAFVAHHCLIDPVFIEWAAARLRPSPQPAD